jgi:nicotinamidase-related amidase
MKLGLMIIDMQKAWYFGAMRFSMDSASTTINSILPIFRSKKLPIIWVQHSEETEGVIPGTEKYEIIENLIPEDTEYKIHKKYMNSFNKTKLLKIINEERIDTLIISGFCAEYCVLTTYRGALDQDLNPILLKNGIASGKNEYIELVENVCELITVNALKTLMN